MNLFWQTIISGVTTGSIYALVGLGLGMIYNVSKVVNLAQGEFLTVGAFLLFSILAAKLPLIVAVPLAVLATALIGLAIEKFAIRPAGNAPFTILLTATVAVSMILQGIAMIIWGKDPLSIGSFSGEKPIELGGTVITTQMFWVVGTLVFVAVLSWYFFNRTLAGKAILAVSENRDAAGLVGINVGAAVRLSYALSAVVGALAGIVVAPITFVVYDGGTMIGLKGFIALTLGGMETIWGGVLGGLVLGLLESLGAGFISAQYKDFLAFVVLIIMLYLRPVGILGRAIKKG